MEITLKFLKKTLKYSSIFYKVTDGSKEGEFIAEGDGEYIISLEKDKDAADILKITLISDYSEFTEEEIEDILSDISGSFADVSIVNDATDILICQTIPCEDIVNLRQYVDNTTEDLLDIDMRIYDFATGADEEMLDDAEYADDDFDEMMTMDDIFDAIEEDVLDDLEYFEETNTNNIGLLEVICSRFSWSDGDEELMDNLAPFWEEYIQRRADAKNREASEEAAEWFCHQCSREIFYAEDDLWAEADSDVDEELVFEIVAKVNPIFIKEVERLMGTGKEDEDYGKKICEAFEIEDEQAITDIQDAYIAYTRFRLEETDLDVLAHYDDAYVMDLVFYIYDCLTEAEMEEDMEDMDS